MTNGLARESHDLEKTSLRNKKWVPLIVSVDGMHTLHSETSPLWSKSEPP